LFLSFFISLRIFVPSSLVAQNTSATAPRLALIVGNSNYLGTSSLANPVNDAEDMGYALDGLGFSAEVLTDAGLEAMENAVLTFRDRLANNSEAVGLFFYAGHGVQSGGENYLIPVDVQIPSESLLRTRAVSLHFVLDSLREAKNKLNVVILDACRDNPFAWARSGNRGLSIVGTQPPGSIVVYSTSAGSTAQDGTGRNGTFTEELLNHIRQPGLEISEIFRRTGAGVQEKTSGAQIPAIYSQFFGSFYPGGAQASADATKEDQEDLPEDFFLPAFFEDAPAYAKKAIASAEENTYYGQWLSAWYSLLEADPLGSDPYILAQKVNIALNGYIEHFNYRGFAFADLDEGEDLELIRYSSSKASEFFDFDPHAQFLAINNSGIAIPPILFQAMGDYYFTLWHNYAEFSENWVKNLDEAFELAMSCYQAAEEAYILVNTSSVLRYAKLLTHIGQYHKTIALLVEITDWEPENTEARKALAEAYASIMDFDQAFYHYDLLALSDPGGDLAYNAYSEAADLAITNGQPKEFEKYVSALEQYFPDDWLPLLLRHKNAVSIKDWTTAKTLAETGLERYPDYVYLLDSLLGSWLVTAEGYTEGFSFLEDQVLKTQEKTKKLVILLFYRAAYRFYGIRTNFLINTKAEIQLIEDDLATAEAINASLPESDPDIVSNIKLMRQELEALAPR